MRCIVVLSLHTALFDVTLVIGSINRLITYFTIRLMPIRSVAIFLEISERLAFATAMTSLFFCECKAKLVYNSHEASLLIRLVSTLPAVAPAREYCLLLLYTNFASISILIAHLAYLSLR
jgi:hypothetical protein